MSFESVAHEKSNSVNGRAMPRLECRKIRKPKIEKLRRARINSSLESLKEILLKNTISIPQGARPTKLEKADILEMTVRYIELLHENLPSINRHQQQQRATSSTTTPQSMTFKQQRRLLNDIANRMNCQRPVHQQKYRHQHSSSVVVYDEELPLLSATSPPLVERENSLDKENFTGVVAGVKQESALKKYHWRPW